MSRSDFNRRQREVLYGFSFIVIGLVLCFYGAYGLLVDSRVALAEAQYLTGNSERELSLGHESDRIAWAVGNAKTYALACAEAGIGPRLHVCALAYRVSQLAAASYSDGDPVAPWWRHDPDFIEWRRMNEGQE